MNPLAPASAVAGSSIASWAQLLHILPALVLSVGACAVSAGDTYYDREIQPILTARCTKSRSGACHVDDGLGRAQGNLELVSYEAVTRRPDVVRRFGSYPMPLLLLKAVAAPPSITLPVNFGDGQSIPLHIRHAGGALLSLEDPAFKKLDEWLQNGATRDGEPPPSISYDPGPCSPVIRQDLFPQHSLDQVDVESPRYSQFYEQVWPVLKRDCLGRECHGARDTHAIPTIELYYTCGEDKQQQRFNYLMSKTYSGRDGRGQLTQKPLEGASYHTGGKLWTLDSSDYRSVVDWSAIDPPYELQGYEGEDFFQANVQPVLVARGCYLEACHSLSNFNFYKPLAGTNGLYGTRVKLHNYLSARFMLGLESPDPRQGRLIKKNLLEGAGGMLHRGGPLFAPMGECDLSVDEIRDDPTYPWFEETSAGCIIDVWHRLERELAIKRGQLAANPGAVGVFVQRPPNPDRHIDFDTYRPGADLMRLDLVLDANGRITKKAKEPTSLLGLCKVDPLVADVRRPNISGDGTQVVFAMRTSESEGLDIYMIDLTVDPEDPAAQACVRLEGVCEPLDRKDEVDRAGCREIAETEACHEIENCRWTGLPNGTDSTGTPIHHFDPYFAPGDYLLFASSMGDPRHADPDRRYASRTPKWFLPNSNIWNFSLQGGDPFRVSFLSSAEFVPRLLHSREVIYAVEKAAPDFYQVSTRALRFDDGGGYRPQLGQRPTMGYGQVVEMVELIDFRTAFIGSDPGTYFGGGTLGVQDITLGLEELEFDGSFPHPVKIIDPNAAARPRQPGTGTYRSPTAMPDGRILVAYSPGEVDLGEIDASVDYGLWVVDPSGLEEPWLLHDTPGQFDIEPALAFKRVFVQQQDRVHQGDPARGEYVFHSIPLFAALMNDNARTGTAPNNDVVAIRVLEQLSPPDGVSSPEEVVNDLHGPERVYVKRRLLGEVPLLSDGSVRYMIPASTPVILELLDKDGNVIDWQREEEQLGPRETEPRMTSLDSFNGICGGCHNAMDGTELGVAPGPDILTGASTHSEASRVTAVDLYSDPASREVVKFTP